MRAAFLDANVFLYALGTDHAYREPCRRILTLAASEGSVAETSVEVLQEVVHVRRRRTGLSEAVARARDILALGLPVHDFERADFEAALGLQLAHDLLSSRDAVHAATMRSHGLDLIISADRDFDQLGEIERLDPLDPAARAALAA